MITKTLLIISLLFVGISKAEIQLDGAAEAEFDRTFGLFRNEDYFQKEDEYA